MREHPLLMKGSLVRATLEGRKTQTRRPVQPWLGRNRVWVAEWKEIEVSR